MMPAAATRPDRYLTKAHELMDNRMLAAILAVTAVFMYISVFVKFGT